MKITVCELNNNADVFAEEWKVLAAHVQSQQSDIVLLPELPFYRWFSVTRSENEAEWSAAVLAHDTWLERVKDLAPATVLATRPIVRRSRRMNEGFLWDENRGYHPVHHKYYLPDEDGFWEATWYERGKGDFEPVETGKVSLGFMICSELWFFEHARAYGKAGADLIVTPRCTEKSSVDKWLVGGQSAAISSGAFSASSNRNGTEGSVEFGGGGWVIDPDGNVLGVTSKAEPFLTIDIDLAQAKEAKKTYPRYIPE
jgi:predicted amidohydrolase